jgi:hypothetical protein
MKVKVKNGTRRQIRTVITEISDDIISTKI